MAVIAPIAVAFGGLAMVGLWIPFTLTHGPTSLNEGHTLAGWDMHDWGFALGVLPNVAIATGLLLARRSLTGRRGRRIALGVVVLALLASALVDLALRALGPPFSLLLLAPATIALAVLLPSPRRWAWAVLGASYTLGVGLALLPQDFSDARDGYRAYGVVAHVVAGLAWIGVAVTLWSRRERQP